MVIRRPIPRDTSDIRGAGGGGKGGGGSPRVAKEAPNTLRSKAVARYVDFLAEGVIGGLVDGDKSIFFNETPVANSDGSINFEGFRYRQRRGLPDQDWVSGYSDIEREFGAGNVEVKNGSPVEQTITDPLVSEARVTIRIPALYQQDKKNGDIKPYSVSYNIRVSSNGGPYQTVHYENINNEKTVSPYERSHRFDLPGSAPWTIQVLRSSADDNGSHLSSVIQWARYTEIISHKLTYPDTAGIYGEVDSQQFGGNIPRRSYEIYGLHLQVPSNYDPDTRAYSGIWDGTFVEAWTDNPAWVFYGLLTNDRWGLGEWIDPLMVDKWSLYEVAQYCDGLVPDGFGGLEPRFTCNGVINTREDAFRVVQLVASCFRAMTYTGTGTVTAAQDRPQDPVILVTPANVIDGRFSYSGTSQDTRAGIYLVTWNDPANFYKPDIEVVEDVELLELYGPQEREVVAPFCTRRGQAYRTGRWMAETSKAELETVTYSAGLDHMIADGTAVMPGDIIQVADPSIAGVNNGGRVMAATLSQVTLDREVTLESGETYTLSVTMPDGTLAERSVSNIPSGQSTGVLTLGNDLPALPVDNATWILTASNVEPTTWRVQSVEEVEDGIVEVTALEHDPTKFARVEQGIDLSPPSYSTLPSGPLPRPASLTAREFVREGVNGTVETVLEIGWESAPDPRVQQYQLQIAPPGQGFVRTIIQAEQSFTMIVPQEGEYRLRVRALDADGGKSDWTPAIYEAGKLSSKELPPGRPAGLELFGAANAQKWAGRDARFVWRRTNDLIAADNPFEGPQGTDTSGDDPLFDGYEIEVRDADGALVRSERTYLNEYTYTYEKNLEDGGPHRTFEIAVYKRRKNGLRSAVPARLRVSNPVPDLPLGLSVTPGTGQIFVSFTEPAESDWVGAKVWAETSSGFDPAQTVPALEGPQNSFVLNVSQNTDYYVRVALYDTYGRETGTLNVSSEIAVTTGGVASPPEFTFTGLTFTPNSPSANQVSWTAGTAHVTDGGATQTYSVVAGSASWASGVLFLYYVDGATALSTSTNIADAVGTDRLILATYEGGAILRVGNGDAFISGSRLLAGTVGAQQLVTGQAIIQQTAQIADAIITAAKIISLDVGKLTSGDIQAAVINLLNNRFQLDGPNQLLTITDAQAAPQTRVRMGRLGGSPEDYGLEVMDAAGNVIFSVNGVSVTADNLLSGTIGVSELLKVADNLGQDRVLLGQVASGQYGIRILGPGGQVLFDGTSTQAMDGTFIKNLTVDTLKITSGALSSTAGYSTSNSTRVSNSWKTVASVTINADGDRRVIVWGFCSWKSSGAAQRWRIRITGGGKTVYTGVGNYNMTGALGGVWRPGGGNHTLRLQCYVYDDSNFSTSYVDVWNRYLMAVSTKR